LKLSLIFIQAKKELHHFFVSPIGYIFLCVFLFSIGYITFEPGKGSFYLQREASLYAFFSYLPWLFLLLIPSITMGVWSEERRLGTLEILLTSPINPSNFVLGKILGCWLFIVVCLICTFPMVITVYFLGSPDGAIILSGYFGALLLGLCFVSIGSFFSLLSKNQMVSFLLSCVFTYLLIVAGSPPVLDFLNFILPIDLVNLFESMSLLRHYEFMAKGVIGLNSIIYFIVLPVCLFLSSNYVLNKMRVRP